MYQVLYAKQKTNYITFNDVTDKYQICDDEISDSVLVKQNENSRLDVSSIDAYGSDKIFFDKGLALERHRKRGGGGSSSPFTAQEKMESN